MFFVYFLFVLTPANICILTYNEYDIIFYRGLLPDMDDLKIIESGGFGISKVNEIFALKKIIKFYIGKRLIESKM